MDGLDSGHPGSTLRTESVVHVCTCARLIRLVTESIVHALYVYMASYMNNLDLLGGQNPLYMDVHLDLL